MRIHKKIMVLATAALMSVGLMACSGGSGTDTGSTDPSQSAQGSGEPVELKFWSWLSGFEPVVDAFNASQENIVVTYEETASGAAGGYAKLSAALEAGNAADIVTVEYPMLPSYASTGGLQPLEKVLNDPDLLEPYSEGVRSLVQLGGSVWGLPYDAPILVYYYRTDLFEEAGIDVPKTWEDFKGAAQTFKEKFPDKYIASFYPNDPLLQLSALSWQNGAKWFDTNNEAWQITIDGDESKEVAQYWQGLIDDDLVSVVQVFSDEWSASLSRGTLAGTLGANWSTSGIIARTEGQEGKWAVAELPNYGTPASAMWGGSTFAVSKDSKNPAAAAEFLQWVTTSEEGVEARGSVGSAILADSKLNAIAKDNFDTAHFGGQDIYKVFESATDSLVPGWTWGPTMANLTEQMTDALGGVTTGSSLEGALGDLQKLAIDDITSLGLAVDE